MGDRWPRSRVVVVSSYAASIRFVGRIVGGERDQRRRAGETPPRFVCLGGDPGSGVSARSLSDQLRHNERV